LAQPPVPQMLTTLKTSAQEPMSFETTLAAGSAWVYPER
jgi:hypothetical protein